MKINHEKTKDGKRTLRLHHIFLTAALLALIAPFSQTQATQKPSQTAEVKFEAIEAMVPMRDGVKLYTVICVPKNSREQLPILLQRTPYGVGPGLAGRLHSRYKELVADGYIFAFQDIRGKYKSEGEFRMNRPPRDKNDPKSVDEASDTYDAIG